MTREVGEKRMSPRTGRPPKNGVTRNKKLTIRLSDDELERIGRCAECLNKTRADTIMRGISLVEAECKK